MNMRCAIVIAAAVLISRGLAKQPSAPPAIPAPLRDLEFGDLNFLHTTDTHGWHGGHLQEPSFSADWGDYVDLSGRLREKLEKEGKDLLLIDTGDRIEGNGLYDSDNPKGLHTLNIFKQQEIDLICIGNHELYQKISWENEYNTTVPAYPNSYIASNLNITSPTTGQSEPLAPRYRKITTKVQGIRITAFGFIFDFTRNDPGSQLRPVEEVVKETWFQEVIADDDVDLFVVIAHAGVYGPELDSVYKAIRAVHAYTPIQFFGGHEHRRAAKQFDLRSYGLASGRFLETIGFQSIEGITGPNKVAPILKFFRRYIDNNLYSFYHHTGLNESTFHSQRGRNVSKLITKARKDLKLDHTFGCSPQDYWMTRVPFPSKDSVYTLLNETILPEIVVDPERHERHRLILINTGGIRFDILKGPFTTDTTYIISPFASPFRYIRDVPYDLAIQVTGKINSKGVPTLNHMKPTLDEHEPRSYNHLAPPGQDSAYLMSLHSPEDQLESEAYLISNPKDSNLHSDHKQVALGPSLDDKDKTPDKPLPLTLGYVTYDLIDSEGDDTIHIPIPYNFVPNVISSLAISNKQKKKQQSRFQPDTTDTPPKEVDLIYNQFIEPDILSAIKDLKGPDYTSSTHSYLNGIPMTDLIKQWISENWKDNCKKKTNHNNNNSDQMETEL